MIGASVCAVALIFGMSVSAAETGAGKVVGEAYKQAEKVGEVADSVGITPSVGGYGTAEQIAVYAGTAISTAGGMANILSGSASVGDVGNVMVGGGMVAGMGGVTSAGALLKNYSKLNSLSDLTNVGGLTDVGMSMIKDMTPELKQLMSMNFDTFGLDGVFGGLGGGLSHPANVWDSQGQQVKNVASAEADIAKSEAKLEQEVAVTASRGRAGNMDGRFGKCVNEDGFDYGPSIQYWIEKYADRTEGVCPHLYIGIECDVTIGKGTYLGETYDQAWKIFKGMTYLDASGNEVSEDTQKTDLRRMYNMLNGCKKASKNGGRSGATFNISCEKNYWKNLSGGRHVEEAQMEQASFDEFCEKHVPVWRDDFVRWGKPFVDLPLECQAFVLDMSMHHGQKAGVIGETPAPIMQQIVRGNVDGAIALFKQSWMYNDELWEERNKPRMEMLQNCKGQWGFK